MTSATTTAGETGVLTEDGVVPIRELAGRRVRVLNGNGGWVEAPFTSYGVQRLMRLTLTRNGRTKVIHATDEHRWFVPSGALRQNRREKLTKELRPGDRLSHSFPGSRVLNPATRPSPFGSSISSREGFGLTITSPSGSPSHSLSLKCS